MNENNNGYDKNVLIVSKQVKEIAFLPGIGKFCKCGCGKSIGGVKVKRKLKSGKTRTYFRPPQKNKVFATLYCKLRFFSRKGQNKYRLTISCGITLSKSGSTNKPYRILTIYGKQNNQTAKFTLTRMNNKLLWDYLDKIEEFRSYKDKQSKQLDQKDSITSNDTKNETKQIIEKRNNLAR